MDITQAYDLTNKAENIVANVRNNMLRNGHPRFIPLIHRANRILWALSNQRMEINRMHNQSSELGLAFLPAMLWVGGMATFGAVSKWMADSFSTTSQIKATEALAEKYGPEQAANLLQAQDKYPILSKILWALGVAIAGYFLSRAFK